MAKNNNLTDFLTDVADAIRAKKGTTEKINPQEFSNEIASITTGGGSVSVMKNDVNFYDCDGTILHSFTKAEFLALSALPDLPTREGLTCQGWNYSLADAQSYVTTYGVCDIGATYITDDGKTRLYIRIAAPGRMTVPLCFTQTAANGVTIDWGDGSATETLSGTGEKNPTHTYTDVGSYIIALQVNSGTLGLGSGYSSECIMGSTSDTNKVYCNMLQKAEIGSGITSIGSYAFSGCFSLATVTLPNSVTSFTGSNMFNSCRSLASMVIPKSVTSLGSSNVFNACQSLTAVSIPNSVTSLGNYTFNNCSALGSAAIPTSTKSIGNYAFSGCESLASVILPNSVTSIGTYGFQSCRTLASLVIPSGVTSIGTYTFGMCYAIAFIDFRSSKSVPTLSSTNAFYSMPSDFKIVVPDSLYSSWTTATNWSTYASQIVKASEFNG